MQVLRILVGFIVLVAFQSCNPQAKCGSDTVPCPRLSEEIIQKIPYRVGDQITFTNNQGRDIIFNLTNYINDQPPISNCKVYAYNPCECESCNPVVGFNSFTNDTTWGESQEISLIIRTQINPVREFQEHLYYHNTVLDLRCVFTIGDTLYQDDDEIFNHYSSLDIGGTVYEDVVIYEVDTLSLQYSKHAIWKSYLSLQSGIVGFHDRKTNSLFYLKN